MIQLGVSLNKRVRITKEKTNLVQMGRSKFNISSITDITKFQNLI